MPWPWLDKLDASTTIDAATLAVAYNGPCDRVLYSRDRPSAQQFNVDAWTDILALMRTERAEVWVIRPTRESVYIHGVACSRRGRVTNNSYDIAISLSIGNPNTFYDLDTWKSIIKTVEALEREYQPDMLITVNMTLNTPIDAIRREVAVETSHRAAIALGYTKKDTIFTRQIKPIISNIPEVTAAIDNKTTRVTAGSTGLIHRKTPQ